LLFQLVLIQIVVTLYGEVHESVMSATTKIVAPKSSQLKSLVMYGSCVFILHFNSKNLSCKLETNS